MSFLSKLFGRKDSQARIALSFRSVGNPVSTPRNYEGFAKEGYSKNTVVFACIHKIAQACAGIEWELYQKRKGGSELEIENHPLLDLIKRPNPMQAQSSFFEYFVAYYMLTGNSFVEAVRPRPTQPPMELWPTRPDKMKIVPGARGYPMAYVFTNGDMSKTWVVDQVKLKADMMHLKSFNPINDWWGMSPLEAALYSLDQANSGNKWNLALLQNSATPSGVLQMKVSDANPGGTLTEEQFARLKNEIENEYAGAKNAGRPMLLEGGLEWKQISMSPKDMEFLENKNVTAIDICQVFGVPPELIGIGQKTFNNYKEARMSFYEDSVLPLMDMIKDELNNWLAPMFGDGLVLKYDKDDIEALAPKREAKFTSVQNASWLTVNEKREATGYEPKEGWDVFVIGSDLVADAESYMTGGPNENEPTPTPPPPESSRQNDGIQEDEIESESDDEGEKGWKAFNLLNRNEKRTSWKRQNSRRKRLEKQFSRDLSSDFNEMYSDMANSIKGVNDAKLVEFALNKVVDENLPAIKRTIQRHLKYTVNDFGAATFDNAKSLWPGIETKSTKQYEDWATRYIAKRTGDAIGQIEGTTRKQVSRVVKKFTERAVIDGDSNAEIAADLREEFASLSKSRSMLIARTEVASASNNASIQAVRSLEIPNMFKEWVSQDDDRSRDGGKDGNGPDHVHMDGVQVPLDEKFTVPPDADMDGPGDASAGPEQICNCRCVLVFKSNNVSRG